MVYRQMHTLFQTKVSYLIFSDAFKNAYAASVKDFQLHYLPVVLHMPTKLLRHLISPSESAICFLATSLSYAVFYSNSPRYVSWLLVLSHPRSRTACVGSSLCRTKSQQTRAHLNRRTRKGGQVVHTWVVEIAVQKISASRSCFALLWICVCILVKHKEESRHKRKHNRGKRKSVVVHKKDSRQSDKSNAKNS